MGKRSTPLIWKTLGSALHGHSTYEVFPDQGRVLSGAKNKGLVGCEYIITMVLISRDELNDGGCPVWRADLVCGQPREGHG